MRRQAPIKRSPGTTGQRTVAGTKAADATSLDDRPLSIDLSRDGKHLIVALPYELWLLSVATLEVERTIELTSPEPSVTEASKDGALWIGGHHLHYGSIFSSTVTKVGTKLADFVDRVCLLRPGLLCGVGHHGEVLWDIEKETPIHRRKSPERPILGLVALEGRAVWADGSQNAWVIDPQRPEGYMQLKLRTTSTAEVEAEGIVALGLTSAGRCILAARDGAVAWTGRHMRVDAEKFPRLPLRAATALAVAGDERWVYVLRPRGLLQRFLVEQPKPAAGEEDDFVPLPEAEECRLEWPAECMLLYGSAAGAPRLVFGGPQADGTLGRLWRVDPASLSWQPAKLGKRTLVEPKPAEAVDKRPDFTLTRSKLTGPGLGELKVDAVLGADAQAVFVTHGHGALLERPVLRRPAAEVLPADALLLPVMIRPREGTARPGLVLWPGTHDPHREPPDLQWLVWGDQPRGWMPLETPQIRAQGWSRADLFPMQIALSAVPTVAGNRAAIPDKWVDPELFQALARECKKLLKVLW
jgi:hypothetical protein